MKERLFILEDRKVVLNTELSASPPPAPRLHPSLAEVYRQKVADLQQTLHEPEAREEALSILRSLVERVVIRPAEPGFTIEPVGEIANMLRISAGSGTFTIEPYSSSVKVVAGARFHLCATRISWQRRADNSRNDLYA